MDRDFVPMGFTGEGAFDAPVVFAGYGAADKEHGYDDYSGIDVKGKVVLAMRYEPHDAKGQSRFTGREDDWSPARDPDGKGEAGRGARRRRPAAGDPADVPRRRRPCAVRAIPHVQAAGDPGDPGRRSRSPVRS